MSVSCDKGLASESALRSDLFQISVLLPRNNVPKIRIFKHQSSFVLMVIVKNSLSGLDSFSPGERCSRFCYWKVSTGTWFSIE